MTATVNLFNRVLVNPNFYEVSAWRDSRIPDDVLEVLDEGSRREDPNEQLRLNRRLLELAFPVHFAPAENGPVE